MLSLILNTIIIYNKIFKFFYFFIAFFKSNYYILETVYLGVYYMAEKINKDINIRELVQKYPNSVRVFSAYGIGCIGCALANFETLEQGLNAHGINTEEFLKDLNDLIAE